MSMETLLFKYANHLAILLTIVAIGIASSIVMPLFRKSIDFRGKVCPTFHSAQIEEEES